MSNGDKTSINSEETTVRKGNITARQIKSLAKKQYNQSKNTNDIIQNNKILQEERKFILILIQIIMKHPQIDEQLKSNIKAVVRSCTRQNRITNQPLVPLLESKLRQIIQPSVWMRMENLAVEYYCAKLK